MKKIERQILVEQVMYNIIGQLHFSGTYDESEHGKDIVIDAITLGCKLEYLAGAPSAYTVTPEGIEAYLSAIQRAAYLNSADEEFKKEVLSGMDKFGHETNIHNAALPSTEKRYDTDRDRSMVSIVDEMRSLSEFQRLTGESMDSIRDGMVSGRIGICRHGGRSHWGKFHSDGKGRGYRTICVNCTKGKRS